MMKRSRTLHYNWYRYKLPMQPPKMDGPAPKDAPSNMNNTKEVPFIDPVEDKFPRSIRGNMSRPDVPGEQYVTNWHVCSESSIVRSDLKPWTAYAPHNAYRLRPFDEFDSRGRDMVSKLRSHSKWTQNAKSGKPFREAFLTKMNGKGSKAEPTLNTKMERLLKTTAFLQNKSPLQQNRDIGREESPHPVSGLSHEKDQFPFSWNTEDWYEYEITSTRQKRFAMQNDASSEVTYKIVLECMWDHHAARLADDVSRFVSDVAKQIVEEKLIGIKAARESCTASAAVDSNLLQAFSNSTQPFHSNNVNYDDDEVKQFLLRELQELEEECLRILNLCNVDGARSSDSNVSWPFVEKIEPWARMTEFWTSSMDKTFRSMERSTQHYEFRKYYRVITAKLPFQSTEFEKRMYDIRHWLHRSTSAEFQTIYKKNVAHDLSEFPIERDVVVPASPENHRLFSFALDWDSAPSDYALTVAARENDSWATIASRYGTTVAALHDCNKHVELTVGEKVRLPQSASKRPTLSGSCVLQLQNGESRLTTWEAVAKAVDADIDELKDLNSRLASFVDSEFPSDVTAVAVPYFDGADVFATKESVYASDTVDSIAARLGTTVDELLKVNGDISDLKKFSEVVVPATASNIRRINDPRLITSATESLFSNSIAEAKEYELDKEIPLYPTNASKFPHEFHNRGANYPQVPDELASVDNWVRYTSTYLDTDLTVSSTPDAEYNVNAVWPAQQIPGKKDRVPFSEDQTWFMQHSPLQMKPVVHNDGHMQDLPLVNNEHFPRSMEWQAP